MDLNEIYDTLDEAVENIVKTDMRRQKTGRVYVLKCSVCGAQYVGSTFNTLKYRMGRHIGNAERSPGNSKLYAHMRDHGIYAMKIKWLCDVPNATRPELCAVEAKYQAELKTVGGQLGLNQIYSACGYYTKSSEAVEARKLKKKASRKAAEASKKFYCSCCDAAFHCPAALKRHNVTDKHRVNQAKTPLN